MLFIIPFQASEWALLRRHPCEDIYGIQIAGNHQDLVGKLSNVLEHETASDFVVCNYLLQDCFDVIDNHLCDL